ncbi:hypothetical protein [Actinomyces sp. Z5]|uniref:hypothetical protein n=1 Tax=Actinomyces sp. Z5 TaxID=2250216 RepID=UPI0011BE3F31|nr:hypothetical protein [Actinomyces sp. Z5]
MSEREDVRGDGSQPRGTASLDDGNDTKEPEQEPAPQKSEPTNCAKNVVGSEQADGLHRFLSRFKAAFAAEKDDSVAVPPDLGSDRSLKKGENGRVGSREKRDKRYERGLLWEHGSNLPMLVVPGMLATCIWMLCVLIENHLEYSPEVFLATIMDIREAGRRCLATTASPGVEGLNQCPYGLDMSVSTGMTLVSGMFAVECGGVAVLGFRARARIGQGGDSDETVARRVFGSPLGALCLWSLMYCLWVPILGVLLLWTPSRTAVLSRPVLVLSESAVPLWFVVAASVVIPIWLYGRVVEYVLEDVERRRRAIRWEYERAYRLIRVKVASDVEARDVVQARGKAAHVGRWIAFGLMLLIGPLLAGTFLPYAPARFLGMFSVLALLDAFCVYFVAYAWSWGRAQGVFLVIVSGFAGCFCAVVTVMCFMVYWIVMSSPVTIPAALAVFVLLVLAWSVVIMRGVDAAKHPVTVIRARRALRRSDELVWLRAQEKRLVPMGMGESAVKARLRGLRRAASRKRPSKRLRAERLERLRRNDKRC